MSLKVYMPPPPHGGKLVDAVIKDRDKAINMAAGAIPYDIKATRDQ